jgi:DNA polymerase-1
VQIHDELLFETKDTELNSELKIIKKEMEEAIYNEMDFSVPLIVDVNSAKNWNEAH